MSRAETTSIESGSTATQADERPLRIVMADDDPNDHLILVHAAEEADSKTEFQFVDDGEELLLWLSKLSADQLPDAIILDLRMPKLDGHKTLDRLQANPTFWQVPVIVFTSSTRPSDKLTSNVLGARYFETKPSTFDEMVDFVHRVEAIARLQVAQSTTVTEDEVTTDATVPGFDYELDLDPLELDSVEFEFHEDG